MLNMRLRLNCLVLLAGLIGIASPAPATAWEPEKSITFLTPGGINGAAGQMATLIRDVAAKYKLLKQPIEVKAMVGKDEANAYLSLKAAKGDAHLLLLSLPNLFTIPLNTAAAFGWQDFTPVSVLAYDEFILWVQAEAPYKTAQELMQVAKSGKDKELLIVGTGLAREDQLLGILMEKFSAPNRFSYQGFPSGGEVANQLAERRADITVNNPIEAVDLWRKGKVRPLCVFDRQRIADTAKVTAQASWNDVPTCAEQGVDVDYKMLRGVLMPGGVSAEQVAFYNQFFTSVKKSSEWKAMVKDAALKDDTVTGDAFMQLLKAEAEKHYQLMNYAGLVSLMKSNFLKARPATPAAPAPATK